MRSARALTAFCLSSLPTHAALLPASSTPRYSPAIGMSAMPQSRSVRRRIRDAILTLLCRPPCPPSTHQATSDLPPGPKPRPDPPSELTPPTSLVTGDPVDESSAQERPGEPSATEPLKDVALSADEGADTALDLASTPSIPTHELPIVSLLPSNPPTPHPCSTLPADALAPATNASADDDVQVHTQPSHPASTPPDDMHNHTFNTTPEHPANSPSAAPSVLSPADSVTPVVPNVEGIDSPLSTAEPENSLSNRETQRQLSLTSSTGKMTNATEAVAAQQATVRLDAPDGRAIQPSRLSDLGNAFLRRFERTGEMSDITKAIAAQQAALRLTPKGHAARPSLLNNLGTSFLYRFERTGDMSDISEAIAAQQAALQLIPEGHTDRASMLSNLGSSLLRRFQRTGDMSNITEAIAAQQAAVLLTPEGHADRPSWLNNLGTSFFLRFRRTGDISDITEAIAAQRSAVQLTPDSHANRPSVLNNLGTSFRHRFERTGDLNDLSEAIAAHRVAVQLTPEGHASLPMRLNNLGNSFLCRFQRTGDVSDIAEAIAAQQAAIQLTPEGHADRPSWLNNLGYSLRCRFERTGDMSNIIEAITVQQAAVRLTPDGHADRPSMLNNLGTSFRRCFERTGEKSDITEAIAAQHAALQLTPDGHANRPSMLNNLGNSFRRRFERTGDLFDLTEAIAAQQAAVRLTPEGHAARPSFLNNLGNSFLCRFQRTGKMSDIEEAIAAQQAAVQLTHEGHTDCPSLLSNLGISILHRYRRTENMSDIMEAITAQQAAVRLTPKGHAGRPSFLNNLGTSFLCRYERTGDMPDIAEAIAAQQAAIQLIPEGHAERPSMLSNLGNSFLSRFEHATSMDDMHSSLKCYKEVTEDSTGAPTVRLRCARLWARLIDRYDPESLDVLVPFEIAVHLLTLVAGLERTLQSRHSQLQDVSGTALHAAAAACRLGQTSKAVEWLEQGRCLVWGQLNGLRTPMDDLQQKDSRLAQRLTQVAGQLESAGSTRAAIDPSMEISAKISLEEAARLHSALAKEWEELLSAARRLPGFETFLLPTPCAALLEGLPDSGPIIIINPHRDRCDALALLRGSDKPLHIPLPDLSLEKAQQYRRALKDVLHSKWIRMRDITQGWSDQITADDAAVSEVLQSLWLEVAKPILDVLGYSRYDTSSNSAQPRIWWCPTGVMSFLPIHAAGIYGDTNSECLMDYVVSSYTPTVTTITDRVKSSRSIDMTVSGLFLTSQPKASGVAEILGTTKEVDELHLRATEKGARTLKCVGDDISVEDCRRNMGEYSSVHLACHASQNASNPLQSRFLLHKGELSLLSIVQMNLKNADLAFLSACQTSTGEEKLSEEAVHLAAGMLAAGYRRVVATMWSISDGQAPRVATDFYEYLWSKKADETGGGFDGSHSAHALHHAVQQLRRRLGNSERDLLTWIPYVHFGY